LWGAPQRRGITKLRRTVHRHIRRQHCANLIKIATEITENSAGKVESIRVFARPWPVVKLFRECMEQDLRADPIPDAILNLPG
jgi:hypothetical protein